jgi:rubredoxin
MATYRCPGCDYVDDESNGAVREGLWESPSAGTRWDDLPEDSGCPDCAVREKPDFEILEVTK